MNQEIINYVKEARGHGLSDWQIKKNLLGAGWEMDLIESNFVFLKNEEYAHPKTAETAHAAQAHVIDKPNPALTLESLSAKPTFDPYQHGNSVKKFFIWLIVLVVVFGGIGYYTYMVLGFYNPDKLWKKFLSEKNPSSHSYDLKVTYRDLTMAGEPVEAELKANGYLNEASTPGSQKNDISLKIKASDLNFDRGLGIILLDNILYIDLGQFPEVSQLSDTSVAYDWVKIDLNSLSEKLQNMGLGSTNVGKSLETQKETVSKIQKVLADNNPITSSKPTGIEKISGQYTVHFTNQVDTNVLAKIVTDSILAILGSLEQTDGSNPEFLKVQEKVIEELKTAVAEFFNQFGIKEYNTWIGVLDGKLYKTRIVTKAPTWNSSENNPLSVVKALSQARAKSRDAKRLADVRQMAAALELYYNDYNRYPDSKDGDPIGLTPSYIGVLPQEPAPSDGNCTDYFNTYWYEVKNNGSGYEFSFCLGDVTGGYSGGINLLTPSGIQAVKVCPSTPENCYKNGQAKSEESLPSFDAELELEITYSNYGITKEITAPDNATDLVEKFLGQLEDAQENSRDAKRLADIRQAASALELYYNDNNKYPENLNELAPTYWSVIPTSPTPADGNCTETENQYSYARLSESSYELSFCLGVETQSYKAGLHKLSPQGIK